MKLVAVSQRVDIYPERKERRDALDQSVCRWLMSAGCCPVPVPNIIFKNESNGQLLKWLKIIHPHAVVLSGGNDIGNDAPERDVTERTLLGWASENRVPVLGICRGMQMMTMEAGGEIIPVEGHVRTSHPVTGEISGQVNSYHAYGTYDCPPGYEVLARSGDGVIEAIRHQSLPWEGWMWHPERELTFLARDIERLRALFA